MKIPFALLLLSLASSATLLAQETPKRGPAEETTPLSAVPARPTSDDKADADDNSGKPGAERPAVKDGDKHDEMDREIPSLAAVLSPTKGNETRGVVTFEPLEDDQVRITARVSGLKPDMKHAIHIHEFGDISSDDGSSAGNHFNPGGKAHGLPDSEERHAGDFGNLEADAEGNANHVLTVKGLSLIKGDHAIIGRAVIVHAGEDKGTQPSGDAGDRIAQGVIAIANPASMKSGVATNENKFPDPSNPSVTTTPETTTSRVSGTTGTAPRSTRSTPAPPTAGERVERAAEKVGEGAGKAARTTVKAVERGVEEVGGALKKVGEKIEDAVE